jgi:hypothetical protein
MFYLMVMRSLSTATQAMDNLPPVCTRENCVCRILSGCGYCKLLK